MNENVFITNECGLHVHVDASDFDPWAMMNLSNNVSKSSGIMNSLVRPDRRDGEFSMAWDEDEHRNFCDSINSNVFLNGADYDDDCLFGTTKENLKFVCEQLDHHMAVSFFSWSNYETVEFRSHHGTLDYDRMKKWIELCIRLTNYSIDNKDLKIRGKNLVAIREFVSKIGLSKYENYFIKTANDYGLAL